jgi:hypothetical protein
VKDFLQRAFKKTGKVLSSTMIRHIFFTNDAEKARPDDPPDANEHDTQFSAWITQEQIDAARQAGHSVYMHYLYALTE